LGRSRTSGQAPGQSVGVLTSLPASGLPGFLELNHTVPASQAHSTLHPNRAIHRTHGGPRDRVELLQCVGRTCHGLIILISDTTGKSLPGPSWTSRSLAAPDGSSARRRSGGLASWGSRPADLASQGPPRGALLSHRRGMPGPRLVHTPSEPSGSQRSPAVSSGRSFAQVAGAILQKQARGQNPDKTPMACGRHEG
jgi:hypothetical protein